MRVLLSLLVFLAAFAVPAAAQDIPGRVGRLAWLEGRVALYQDPDRGWEEAYVNYPITSENSVWTDSDARAELQVGPIALRMDEESQLDVSRLDDETLDTTLERGTMAIRVHHLRPRRVVRLSTPQASFVLEAEGRYRLDADPDRGESRLSVFAGEARMEAGNGAVRIRAGDSVVVWGEDRPSYAFQPAYLSDFDRWAMARDDRWVERRAPEYVSYEMTGYEDLDAYGEWSRDPTYGMVWFPTRVSADWAPYRYGRWAYVRPWGWTWVDEEPWGYAPFHYGRWVHLHDRWAWCPGRRVEQPVWAPALVAFIGGSGWSVGASTGGPVVGWYPLAPSEPYRPWYRASRSYVNQVNTAVINVPDRVAREHREWNRDRAATVVRREAIAAQRPVQQARVSVPAQALRAAPAITAPAAALPSHTEVREARRREGAAAAAPPPRPQPRAREGAAPAPAAAAPPASAAARPSFAKPRVAPRPAAQGAAPPPASAPVARKPPPVAGPAAAVPRTEAPGALKPAPAPNAAREAAQERAKAAREAEQNRAKVEQDRAKAARETEQNRAKSEQDRAKAAREAEQNRAKSEQDRAKAAREAQQNRAEQDRAKAAREAEQNRAKTAREAEQNRAKAEQDRTKAAREAEQNRAKAAREAEQNRAKASREAEQQRLEAARKAQQDAAQQAQQRRAAEEAGQKAARQAEQNRTKAAREAEQQRAEAARKAQLNAAQQAQRRAAEQPQEAQKRSGQEAQQKGREPRRVPPEERGNGKEKDKDQGRGEGG